jgi:hypothetical protein
MAQPPGKTIAIATAFPAPDVTGNPPDTQIAVGERYIVAMNNDGLFVWDKLQFDKPHPKVSPDYTYPLKGDSYGQHGIFPTRQYKDNNNQVVTEAVTDPWLLYDPASKRWIASALVFSRGTAPSTIWLAISPQNNPEGQWTVKQVATPNQEPFLHDQPKIALTRDKILVGWSDFRWNEGVWQYVGGSWAAFSSAAALGNNTVVYGTGPDGPNPCQPYPIPARGDGSSDTAYLLSTVYPDSGEGCNGRDVFGNVIATPTPEPPLDPKGSPHAGNVLTVVRVEGVPPDIAVSEQNLPVNAYSAAAGMKQKGAHGAPSLLDGGDTKILSAFLVGQEIWAAANGACVDKLGMPSHGCFRLFGVLVNASGPLKATTGQDVNIAMHDRDILYPALAFNSEGAIFAAIQGSLDQDDAHLGAGVFARLQAHSDYGVVMFAKGAGILTCPDATPTRIGDYSGADRDPSSPNDVWVALEVSTRSGCHQGATIAKVTFR